ncbi:MAG: zinc ribbon domain-containing protein [Pseudomonadota bacterium]
MPLYDYKCRACDLEEERLAGIDDRTLICTECGEVMDRQISDDEAFAFYWDDKAADEAGNVG